MPAPLLLLSALACSERPPACVECAPCPAPAVVEPAASGDALTAWETSLLGDQLTDLRAGIRPYGERGWGLCTGTRTCEDFLGPAPGTLSAGSHLLRAELVVPQLGEGWKVRLDTTCDTGEGDAAKTDTASREFSLRYAGEGRGYRLEPLLRVEAPGGRTARSCTATLTPLRPDGEQGPPLTAAWTVPAREG